jgi:hypothetical protein
MQSDRRPQRLQEGRGNVQVVDMAFPTADNTRFWRHRTFRSSIEHQRSIVLCLRLKATLTQGIHDDLAAMPGDEALAYNIATKHLRKAQSDTAKSLSDLDASSPHTASPTGLSWQP